MSKRKFYGRCRHKSVSKMPAYKCWLNMKRRCLYPDEFHKKYYENVKICDEWMDSYTFCSWAEKNGYREGLTLDRVNVNGNYEPKNCRFIDAKEQGKSGKRNLSKLTINGVTKTITEWARENGIRENTIRMRIKYGYFGEDLLRPTKKYDKEHSFWEMR